MNNKFLILMCILLNLTCKAQLSIMQYPLQGLELKPSDIFKADIQNMENIVNKVYLSGSIINTTTGEQIVTARTGAIDIAPGMMSITESMLAPRYTINSSTVSQTGTLPYGNYRICLNAIKVTGIEEVASACQETEITPLSPPLLLSPENQSTVSEQYPLLVWLPPMPISKDKVVYDLKLVEILPNQTPYDALQRNFAVIERQNIDGTTLQYPASATQLEEGKKYAWKVVAKTQNRKPIGETEIWWFTKEKNDNTIFEGIVLTENYIIPKYTSDNRVVFVGNFLKVYMEDYPDNLDFKFNIYDGKHKQVNTKSTLVTEDGHGRFTINLNGNMSLKNDGYYTLEVEGLSGITSYIFFRYIKKK